MKPDRKKAGIAALAVLFGVTLWLVLPAFASNPGDFVDPWSSAKVYPYDVAIGGTGDCTNLFTSPDNSLGTGIREYDNVNPKSTSGTNISSGHNDNVKFGLTMNTDNNKNQLLEVRSSGAAILGIGIKGGTQSTAYNYKRFTTAGFVTSDAGLHGPLQTFTTTTSTTPTTTSIIETGAPYYSISQLTVCYTVLSYIQGTVYEDINQDSHNNDGSTSPRSGWTVQLYSGVTPGVVGGGKVIAHQTTTADGSYHFDIPADGTNYRVCEVPNPTDTPPDNTNVWVETQPLPDTTTLCNGVNDASTKELAKGYDFTPTSSAGATDNFGNVGGFECDSPIRVGIDPYAVGNCKVGETYVFFSGTLDGTPNGTPFVDYWVSDPNKASVPVVEQLNFANPFLNGQPKYTKLLYADGGGFPVTLNNLLPVMNYCKVDPRTDSGFTLSDSYKTLAQSVAVLPGADTSCVISIRTTAPKPGTTVGSLQAYVYALGDSGRLPN